MIEYSVLVDRDSAKEVEEEECNNFVKSTLEALGLDISEIWPNTILTITQKVKLRDFLEKLNVVIIDNKDREFEIYVDRDLIAKWHKPFYSFKIDHSEINSSKKMFYEIKFSFDSIFEDE